MNRDTHIIIAEPSSLIFEGLVAVILSSGVKPIISRGESLEEIQRIILKRKADVIFINPHLVQNHIKVFNTLKQQTINGRWIGLVYAYHEQQLLSMFDTITTISDTPELILDSIKRIKISDSITAPVTSGIISERELDVLKLLVSGLTNKEIAGKLNISINTVITHRKNISQKTGLAWCINAVRLYTCPLRLIHKKQVYPLIRL